MEDKTPEQDRVGSGRHRVPSTQLGSVRGVWCSVKNKGDQENWGRTIGPASVFRDKLNSTPTPVPDEDHIARYCKPSTVECGMPTVGSFMRRESEEHLSVNWLERSGQRRRDDAVACIREILIRKGYGVRKGGRFAIVNVGSVKARVGNGIRIDHLPEDSDHTHSGIHGYAREDELEVATALSMLVAPTDVYPGLQDSR